MSESACWDHTSESYSMVGRTSNAVDVANVSSDEGHGGVCLLYDVVNIYLFQETSCVMVMPRIYFFILFFVLCYILCRTTF